MLSKNIKETEIIARKFLEKILKKEEDQKGALVVCLCGDLGAGKTAFTKSAAKHLRIKHTVGSPTFVIMKKYPVRLPAYDFLFHIDAYRLKNEEELLQLGWREIIADKRNLVFIEWPEHVSKVIPRSAAFVRISTDKNGRRNFKFK